MLPNLDQTTATGLVTLPGAFVGAVFAGASPAEAARFQLIVLLATTVTATVVVALASRGRWYPPARSAPGDALRLRRGSGAADR